MTAAWTYGQPRERILPVAAPPAPKGDYQPRHPETRKLAERVFASQARAGRAYGGIKGYNGRPGGWIYTTTGNVLCHGWASLVSMHVHYDREAKGYRFGARALRRLDEWLDARRPAPLTADAPGSAAAARMIAR